jgi:heavy-metal exporter, HME family
LSLDCPSRSPAVCATIVYVEFDWGTDIYRNRQQVTERLAVIQGQLPANVRPQLGPVTSIMGEIMLVAISGASAPAAEGQVNATSAMDVREFADYVVRPQLLTIPGISQVIPIGGEVRQYRVTPNLVAMQSLDVTPDQIEAAIRRFGSNTAGGFVDQNAREYLIRNIGTTLRLDDLRNVVVATRQSASSTSASRYARRTSQGWHQTRHLDQA